MATEMVMVQRGLEHFVTDWQVCHRRERSRGRERRSGASYGDHSSHHTGSNHDYESPPRRGIHDGSSQHENVGDISFVELV
jgi:hypothetical protein